MRAWVQSHRSQVIQTLAVCSGFLALGVSQGIRGPTLLDLGIQVQEPLSAVSLILTARAVGHLIGSLVSE